MTPEDARHHARALHHAAKACQVGSASWSILEVVVNGYEALAKELEAERDVATERELYPGFIERTLGEGT